MPLKIVQTYPFVESEIALSLYLTSAESKRVLSVQLPIKQLDWPPASPGVQIKATYLYAETAPTAFYAVPPLDFNGGSPAAPVIALRESVTNAFDISR